MQLQENTLFANRYQLINLLGRGGFSEVWLAKDNWTHLKIALKVYAPGTGMDANGLQEFCGELASVYDLNHTNLLKPQHVDTWENMPYLIMAYCSQGSCGSKLGKMSETEMWKFIHDVAAGLAYLHGKDVVHQDIKPDNILIDDAGNYLITDFGVSTRARSTLRKSVVSSSGGGTTAYMGPERFSRQPAPTKASDIWSFGAMCFELLEGVVPFGEIGGGMQKGGAEIPAITADVSDALKYTITKMLQKETWDRPTAATLVEWASNPNTIKVEQSLLEETEPVATPSVDSADSDRSTQRLCPAAGVGQATQRVNTPPLQSKSPVSITAPSKKTYQWKIALFFGFIIVAMAIIIGYEKDKSHRNQIRAEYSSAVQDCYSELNKMNPQKPQTIITVFDNGFHDSYSEVKQYEIDNNNYLEYLNSANIATKWDGIQKETIEYLRRQQKKEYDNWGYSTTFYKYNEKIQEIERLKL